jgi:hypothetical protein
MKLIDNLMKLKQVEEHQNEDNLKSSSINFMRFNNELLNDNILIQLFNQYEQQQQEQKTENPLGLIQLQNECFYLNKTYFIVGRKSKFFNKCDLNIEKSNFVSRIHFVIELNNLLQKFFIYCISKNGIFINNRYLQRGIPIVLENK